MLFTKSFHIQRKYLLIRSFIYFQTRRCSPDLSKFIMRQDKSPFCQKNLNTQSIPSHFENRAGQGPISSKESKNSIYSTEKKIQNFPIVRTSRTRTFQTERVNRFCDKNALIVHKSLLQTCNFTMNL